MFIETNQGKTGILYMSVQSCLFLKYCLAIGWPVEKAAEGTLEVYFSRDTIY